MLVVYNGTHAMSVRDIRVGNRVQVSSDDPQIDGAVGRVVYHNRMEGKYTVRIPRARCLELCKKDPSCVRPCPNEKATHKGWCRTKTLEHGCGLMQFDNADLTLSDNQFFHPGKEFAIKEEEDVVQTSAASREPHASSSVDANMPPPVVPVATPSPSELSESAGMYPASKRPKLDTNSYMRQAESKLRQFMLSEIGLTEEFADATSKEIVSRAQAQKGFHPFVCKIYDIE